MRPLTTRPLNAPLVRFVMCVNANQTSVSLRSNWLIRACSSAHHQYASSFPAILSLCKYSSAQYFLYIGMRLRSNMTRNHFPLLLYIPLRAAATIVDRGILAEVENCQAERGRKSAFEIAPISGRVAVEWRSTTLNRWPSFKL